MSFVCLLFVNHILSFLTDLKNETLAKLNTDNIQIWLLCDLSSHGEGYKSIVVDDLTFL